MISGKTALDLLRDRNERGCCLSLGDRILNSTVGGGIFTNYITEISGEAGAGKTQFCLVLALQCHLDRSLGGLGGSAIYLSCGEGQFPDRRLDQLSEEFAAKYSQVPCIRPVTQRDFLNNVHVLTLHHTGQAQEALSRSIPDLCLQQGVRLLIVDSLAGMARTEFDSSQRDDMKMRTAVLFSLAGKLKWLADTFGLAVVVVNQVTAGGFDNSGPRSSGMDNGGAARADAVPALGLVWTACVNTRILLRRHVSHSLSYGSNGFDPSTAPEGQGQGQGQGQQEYGGAGRGLEPAAATAGGQRSLHLEFSPFQGQSACSYCIARDGVHGLQPLWIP
jgi:DNA-repair protein XRCC3